MTCRNAFAGMALSAGKADEHTMHTFHSSLDMDSQLKPPDITITPSTENASIRRLRYINDYTSSMPSSSELASLPPLGGTTSTTSKRQRSRLLHKNGSYNVLAKNIPQRRIRLLTDFWNTLVDLRWRYILLLFLLSYFLTWSLFGLSYYLSSYVRGDLQHLDDQDWRPCVNNLRSLLTAYLFSLESQHTIGYGSRYITDQCWDAIVLLCFQSAIGVAIQAFMIGLIFAKVQRPKKRAQTLLFSTHAVVCARDRQLCLLFRVGNARRSLIIQSVVHAQLVHHRKTAEGELLPFHQHEMQIRLDSMSSGLLAWPVTACHVIDAQSPLYEMSRATMAEAHFELIVTLEGVIESTGQTLQARTSYLPEEILWAHRFGKLLSYRQSSALFVVNFERFNMVEAALGTPSCSAAELDGLLPAHALDQNGVFPVHARLDEPPIASATTIEEAIAISVSPPPPPRFGSPETRPLLYRRFDNDELANDLYSAEIDWRRRTSNGTPKIEENSMRKRSMSSSSQRKQQVEQHLLVPPPTAMRHKRRRSSVMVEIQQRHLLSTEAEDDAAALALRDPAVAALSAPPKDSVYNVEKDGGLPEML